ncbi:MAG: S8 family serine peptidase [Candidatus Competibacterales bacterium]
MTWSIAPRRRPPPLLALALGLGWAAHTLAAAPTPGGDPLAKVEGEVLAALAAPEGRSATPAIHPTIYVVVLLSRPAAADDTPLDLEALAHQVHHLQDRVLAHVAPGAFRPVYRYALTAALTGFATEEGIAQLAASPAVVSLGLDGELATPRDDPDRDYPDLESKDTSGGTGAVEAIQVQVGADAFTDLGISGRGAVVAVLDSGVDNGHPDLAASLIPQQACFVDSGDRCPNGGLEQFGVAAAQDDAGHGTFVAGIIAADGTSTGLGGMAPGAEILGIKVLDNCSFSGCFSRFSQIVQALDYLLAARPEVDVVNLSLGTSERFAGACDTARTWIQPGTQIIELLRQRGTLTVAASMNDGDPNAMAAPACIDAVVSVGNADFADRVHSGSNRSATLDVLAPGVGIDSLALGGGIQFNVTGTSFAAAAVTACGALLLEEGLATSPAALEARLVTSPVTLEDPVTGRAFPRLTCTPAAGPCIAAGALDGDCDGIPDIVEIQQGTDVAVKDNHVFADDRLFVMQTYRDFLGREGDAAGIAFWTAALEDGLAPPTDLVTLFLDSPEFTDQIDQRFPGQTPAQETVTALYVGMLARDPEPAGLDFWAAAFGDGVPRQALIQAFMESQEYHNRFLPAALYPAF